MLLSEQPAAQAGPRRLAPGVPWLIGLTAVLVGTLALVVGEFGSPVATASSLPRPLTATPIDRPVDDVLAELQAAAAAQPSGVAADGSYRVMETFQGSVFVEGAPEVYPMQPEFVTRTRAADGSLRELRVAGSADGLDENEEVQVLPPGSIISDTTLREDAARTFLGDATPEELRSSVLDDYRSLATEHVLRWFGELPIAGVIGGPEQATAIGVLRSTQGVTLLGDVIDREGRDGIAIGMNAPMRGSWTMLIFDEGTGKLLSAETIDTNQPEGFPATSNDVIHYSIWRI
jgi:hypothetical protein